jgi:hypothetical protein
MIFMLQHHNPIETAYASDDLEFLHELAKSEAYVAAFDDMLWDEAYDRYECVMGVRPQMKARFYGHDSRGIAGG